MVNFFFLNQRGQAGQVFRIFVGAVIGLAIFAIIYSLITQTGKQQEYLLDEIFFKKMEMAVNNPIGSDYLIDDISAKKGAGISTKYLSYKTGMNENCFEFKVDPIDKPGVSVKSDEGIYFDKDLTIDFLVNCYLSGSQGADQCATRCSITVK